MPNKTVSFLKPMLTVVATIALISTVVSYQGLLYSGVSGRIVSPASATGVETLEKNVGQNVAFKVKIKNTGNVEATYVIVAEWREHGAEDWETVGQETVTLSPGQHSEVLTLGTVECCEEMVDKYFDVRFVLYDAETEAALDDAVMNEAWVVRLTSVCGAIYSCWIE